MANFFIGGMNRSGTTLLQSILCSDSSTNPLIHEASYLRNIVEAYAFGIQKFDEHNKYYFSSVNDMRGFTAKWAGEFLNKTRNRYPNAKNLVLKHPPLTARFPDLYELLSAINEDSKFLIILRDPRDVVASLVKVGETLRSNNESEGNTLPRDMATLANYYMQCYMPALSSQNDDYRKSLMLVKYEDLVNNPQSTINQLREWSGLELVDFDEGDNWKNDNINYDSLKENKNAWLSDLWGKKLSNSRVGSYKKILKPEEIKLLEKVCAGPLQSFGYK